MSKLITEWAYYQQEQKKHPEALLLMKDYDAYYILGERCKDAAPVLEPLLTHKDVGKCYCYDVCKYTYKSYLSGRHNSEKVLAYSSFSFGRHNLEKVLPALIRTGMRVGIIDFNEIRNSPEQRAEEDRILRTFNAKEEEKKRKEPVQLVLEFEW